MKKLHTYVAGQIKQLEEIRGTSGGKARLARLRRGVGKIPGELPELWGEFLNGIPEEFLSKSGEATKGEWAIYLSLTLYALHQQGNNDSMNKKGESLVLAFLPNINLQNSSSVPFKSHKVIPLSTSNPSI